MAKLRWRCRRGMHELDVLLESWLLELYPQVSDSQRRLFSRLLEFPDPLLWDWLILSKPCPDPELAELCQAIVEIP